MSARPDFSLELVHFTSGGTLEEAFGHLRQIISSRRLVGGGAKIRGGYRCVCFTEAPVRSLNRGFMNLSSYSRYSPFGILVRKDWLFGCGGRPVIYQPEAEFDLLPEEVRWRHMRYEPGTIDFTWEREWRIQCDELRLEPANAEVVLPAGPWEASLVSQHDAGESLRVEQYSQVMEDVLAEQYREPFPWTVNTFGAVSDRA